VSDEAARFAKINDLRAGTGHAAHADQAGARLRPPGHGGGDDQLAFLVDDGPAGGVERLDLGAQVGAGDLTAADGQQGRHADEGAGDVGAAADGAELTSGEERP